MIQAESKKKTRAQICIYRIQLNLSNTCLNDHSNEVHSYETIRQFPLRKDFDSNKSLNFYNFLLVSCQLSKLQTFLVYVPMNHLIGQGVKHQKFLHLPIRLHQPPSHFALARRHAHSIPQEACGGKRGEDCSLPVSPHFSSADLAGMNIRCTNHFRFYIS